MKKKIRKKKPQLSFNSRKLQLLTIVLPPLIACIFIATSLKQTNTQTPKPIYPSPTSIFTPPSPTPTNAVPQSVPYAIYTSEKLGVSFSYQTIIANVQYIHVREIGNKIYLYDTIRNNQPFDGSDEEFLRDIKPSQHLDVIEKDPSQSLADSIKHHFLQGYSENDCFVIVRKTDNSRTNPLQQTAIIDYPDKANVSFAERNALLNRCPSRYVYGPTASYFMMDPHWPNKFFFIKLGQDNILGKNGTWDQTIEVYK